MVRFDPQWWIRGLLPAAIVGSFIGLLMRVGRGDFDLLPTLGSGSIIGICCFTASWVFESLFATWVCRFSKPVAWMLRGVMYTVAGVLGFIVGLTISLMAIWRVPLPVIMRDVAFGPMLLTASGIALFLGIVAYSYFELRARLEQSIARLKEHEFAEKELELARAIQSRLLPPSETEGPGYRVSARNLAARYVAGDFYDVFNLGDGSLGLVVADVSGKGMGASLIMATVKAVLPILAAGKSVEVTLNQLNTKLAGELGRREFVALAMARFDPSSGLLQLANAGLPDPYLLRPGEQPAALTPPGPRLPLGIRPAIAYEMATIQLEPGERFLMFSDGLPEAPTAGGEPLGYEALTTLLSADGHTDSAGQWLDALFAKVRALTSDSLEDDWTALLIERK